MNIKMYKYLFSLGALLLLFGHVLKSEDTVLWGPPDIEFRTSFSVLSHIQINSEIRLVIRVNDVATPCLDCDYIPTEIYNTYGPSFAATAIDVPLAVPDDAISLSSTVHWDPLKGDGWVNHADSFGEVWLRHYPWTYWNKMTDWRYIFDGGIIWGNNAYWIWSNTTGWLWTTRGIYPWIWEPNKGWSREF